MRPGPLPTATPSHGRRGVHDPGSAPFWESDRPIRWQSSAGHEVGMRVVQDDASGLVAWVAAGSQRTLLTLADGGPVRRDGVEDQTADRRAALGTWQGPGTLFIAPTGLPWSVWLFWDETDGHFVGWYVNLETPHLRNASGTWTEDQILDLLISPSGSIQAKDAGDLDAAVAAGRLTPARAAEIHADADRAAASFRAGSWPFDEEWTKFAAPASWTALTLADLPDW